MLGVVPFAQTGPRYCVDSDSKYPTMAAVFLDLCTVEAAKKKEGKGVPSKPTELSRLAPPTTLAPA